MILLNTQNKLLNCIIKWLDTDITTDRGYHLVFDDSLSEMISRFHPTAGSNRIRIIKDQMLIKLKVSHEVLPWTSLATERMESMSLGYKICRKQA